MPAFESEQLPQSGKERTEASPLPPDSARSLGVNPNATVTALKDLLTHDDTRIQEPAPLAQNGETVAPSSVATSVQPRTWRQGMFVFPSESDELPVADDSVPPIPTPNQADAVSAADLSTEHHTTEGQSRSSLQPPYPAEGLFGFPISSGRQRSPLSKSANGAHQQSHRGRIKTAHDEQTLFDFLPVDPASGEPQIPAPDARPPPAGPIIPTAAEALDTPNLVASCAESSSPTGLVVFASGEKAKAYDIVAAIRALKAIENERRDATLGERLTLARFAGFGPVALSIFPDPITGRYKDATWEGCGLSGALELA